jgi:hypothetical protein
VGLVFLREHIDANDPSATNGPDVKTLVLDRSLAALSHPGTTYADDDAVARLPEISRRDAPALSAFEETAHVARDGLDAVVGTGVWVRPIPLLAEIDDVGVVRRSPGREVALGPAA